MGLTAITQTVHVDLNTGKSIPTVFVHQNDTSRTIIFKVTNNGTPFDLSDYTIKFAYKSPIVNGQYSVIAGASMVDGEIESEQIGWVYFTPTDDYTSIGGVGLLTMILTPSDQTENVRPVNIRLVVQKSADGDDSIAGSSDFPATLDEIAENWLDENISIQIDDTLSVSGKAADAKVTGDEISDLDGQIDDLKSDINNEYHNTMFGVDYATPSNWWEPGNITNGINDSFNEVSRIRTKDILSFDEWLYIGVTAGQYFIVYYTENNEYDRTGTWQNSNNMYTIIPANTKFRVVACYNTPADTTPMPSISAVSNQVNFYFDSVNNELHNTGIVMEHGGLENGENNTYAAGARIRPKEMLNLSYDAQLNVNGYCIVHYYDPSGIFMYRTDWINNSTIKIPKNTNFRFVFTLNNTSALFVPLETIMDGINIIPIDNNMGLSPNIIYQCRNTDDTHIPPYSKWYIQSAFKNGYDRVRFNVRRTTDGYYFLCHDDYINTEARNPDGTEISSNISANGRTLAELNLYDWGIKYGDYFAHTTVPLLEDALKYSSMYNMGVSLELSMGETTDEQADEIIQMCAKYGCIDQLIIISVYGGNINQQRQFINKNPRINAYIGHNQDFFTSERIELIKQLQTPYNKVYIQLYPWGTLSTDEFIEMGWKNNFFPYNSTIMTESALLTENMFNKGYAIIEASNVKCIKDTVSQYTDTLI